MDAPKTSRIIVGTGQIWVGLKYETSNLKSIYDCVCEYGHGNVETIYI